MNLLSSLVAYWSLEEDTPNDRIGLVGSIPLVDGNTVPIVAGINGNAASFTRSNSEYLEKSDGSFMNTTGDLTVAFWYRPASDIPASTTFHLVSRYLSSGTRCFSVFYANGGSGKYLGCIWSPDGVATEQMGQGEWTNEVSTSGLSTGAYHLFIFYHDDTNGKCGMRIDDTYYGEKASSGLYLGGIIPFVIGSNASHTAGTTGYIDEVGVWHRLLTTQEKTDLYNSGSGLFYPFGSRLGDTQAVLLT